MLTKIRKWAQICINTWSIKLTQQSEKISLSREGEDKDTRLTTPNILEKTIITFKTPSPEISGSARKYMPN